jgi:hypothetical protein
MSSIKHEPFIIKLAVEYYQKRMVIYYANNENQTIIIKGFI